MRRVLCPKCGKLQFKGENLEHAVIEIKCKSCKSIIKMKNGLALLKPVDFSLKDDFNFRVNPQRVG